jgi:hypothetical protein
MGKKRKSPWPFQKVLGSKRQFILLFGAHECFLPVLGHIRQPISPNSWLFPFYHYPQSRGITFLLDMKRSFFGLSLSKRKGLALLPHFLLLQWVVVKLREKLLVTTVTFQISVHTTHKPSLLPTHIRRICWSQQDGSAVAASRQLALWRQKAAPPHRCRGGRSLRPISNYRRQR